MRLRDYHVDNGRSYAWDVISLEKTNKCLIEKERSTVFKECH